MLIHQIAVILFIICYILYVMTKSYRKDQDDDINLDEESIRSHNDSIRSYDD